MTEWGADRSPGKRAVECVSGVILNRPIYGIDLVSWEQSAGHTE